MKKNVVIGLIGSVLDAGTGPSRWDRWRPSVALCQHDNLLIDRFELIYQEKFLKQSMLVMEDIRSVSRKRWLSQPELNLAIHGILRKFMVRFTSLPAIILLILNQRNIWSM